MKPGLIYVLYGTDRFTRDEQVRALRRRFLEEPMGELNLTELDGRAVGLAELRAATDAVPFLAPRRLVVVEALLGRLAGTAKPAGRRGRTAKVATAPPEAGPESELEQLLAYLGEVPESTALMLVEERLDPALVQGRIAEGRAYVRAYERPRPAEVGRWIERRVKHHRGSIEAAAARQLAQLAPEDLGLLDGEIVKLVTYADGRAVTTEDVALLSATPDVTIFGLLDAIADGQRRRALTHLRAIFQRGERPEAVLPQIAAALRRLVQARELLDGGQRGPALQRRLGVHPFLAEKTERQAAGYRIEQLEVALRLLLQADRRIKTGEAEPELALELFIADLPRG